MTYESIDDFIFFVKLQHPSAETEIVLGDAVRVKAYGQTWGVVPRGGVWSGPGGGSIYDMSAFWGSIAKARAAHSEARVTGITDTELAERVSKIESFLWSECGYAAPRAFQSFDPETVAPKRAHGRAGEGDPSRKARARSYAEWLVRYCNEHGYEGIGHSIGLLMEELKR